MRWTSLVASAVLIINCALTANHLWARTQSDPAQDPDFLVLADGQDLRNVRISNTGLSLSKGLGQAFTTQHKDIFTNLVQASKSDHNHKVQWTLMDLDAHQIIDQSSAAERKVFGASVSKIYVGATLLQQQSGHLTNSQLQLMANMLVVSSNSAWINLQNQIGDGDTNLGRERIQQFTQQMGYERTRGFQGYLGELHGNELVARELVEFLYDTYVNRFNGADTLWKIMHTCRTGQLRARKYLPSSLIVGGKTGTYDGTTVDPETGLKKNPDGSDYKVKVRHHVIVFKAQGRQYGLAVLANSGSDESAALLAGGFYRQLTTGVLNF